MMDDKQEREEAVRTFVARLHGLANICALSMVCTKEGCSQDMTYAEPSILLALVKGLSDGDTKSEVLSKVVQMNLEETVAFVALLGVWISEDLIWDKNTQKMCRKAYSRISMLTKLRYVGVSTEDLIDIYVLFIRSITEYCAVAWHSSMTVAQATDIERIQKTCMRGHIRR